jgi:hypothetical protein
MTIHAMPLAVFTEITFCLSLDEVIQSSTVCRFWSKEMRNFIKARMVHITVLSYKDLLIFRHVCTEYQSDLNGLLQKFRNVRTFILGKDRIPCLQLFNIGKGLSHITTVDASGQTNLEYSLFGNLLNPCPNIETLSLASCPEANAGYVKWIITKCPFITELNLSETPITDDTLKTLTTCQHLKRVHITGCKQVTEVGITHLVSRDIQIINTL